MSCKRLTKEFLCKKHDSFLSWDTSVSTSLCVSGGVLRNAVKRLKHTLLAQRQHLLDTDSKYSLAIPHRGPWVHLLKAAVLIRMWNGVVGSDVGVCTGEAPLLAQCVCRARCHIVLYTCALHKLLLDPVYFKLSSFLILFFFYYFVEKKNHVNTYVLNDKHMAAHIPEICACLFTLSWSQGKQ